ncbi:MAG: alpha/beta fold hydrolase [Flavobacteriales bacterium]|nr:alpha/beta fold hydrolase [Flavobacteriales bacterium]
MHSTSSFTHGPTTLAYRSYGHGPTVVLAFHGFGRTGADFALFEPMLAERCTIHAFDLHFHGESSTPGERAHDPFTPAELAAYFTAFADHLGADKLTLLGYSLGGRIALSLLNTMPDRVANVVLVAPDGLKTRPWYRGLAASRFGRHLYGRFVENPHRVHAIMNTLHGVGLMRPKLHRFLMGQTDNRVKRQQVHDVWLSYRLIEPDLSDVGRVLRERAIPLHLFLGRTDSVIPAHLAQGLKSQAPELVHVQLLEAGHVLLTPELAPPIANVLGKGA